LTTRAAVAHAGSKGGRRRRDPSSRPRSFEWVECVETRPHAEIYSGAGRPAAGSIAPTPGSRSANAALRQDFDRSSLLDPMVGQIADAPAY